MISMLFLFYFCRRHVLKSDAVSICNSIAFSDLRSSCDGCCVTALLGWCRCCCCCFYSLLVFGAHELRVVSFYVWSHCCCSEMWKPGIFSPASSSSSHVLPQNKGWHKCHYIAFVCSVVSHIFFFPFNCFDLILLPLQNLYFYSTISK